MKFSQNVVCAVLKNGNAPPIVPIRETASNGNKLKMMKQSARI